MPKSRTPEYVAWRNMLQRCKPGRKDSDRYYSRGVTVCDRWNPQAGGSFQNFLDDMGNKPGPEYSLDKDGLVPGNLVYGPGLCRWATRSEQATARRNTIWLTHGGTTLSLQGWANRLRVKRCVLARRLSLGWSVERTLTAPLNRETGRIKPTRFITHEGKTLSLAEWSRATGIRRDTLSYRLSQGWSVSAALTTPPGSTLSRHL